MNSPTHVEYSRRALLHWMYALPFLVLPPSLRAVTVAASSAAKLEDALNVMDFEGLARAALPPAHFGYIATGVDDDRTVAWNHEAFSLLEIRSRRFVDVSKLDTTVQLFGHRWLTPIYLSAVSAQGAFHPDAELGTAGAAATRSALMMLSSAASRPLEDVVAARDASIWYQLYATDDWNVTRAVVKRAERAGCPAIALTVDNIPGRNNETLQRAMRVDERPCSQCHINNSHDFLRKAPIFSGLDMSHVKGHTPPGAVLQSLVLAWIARNGGCHVPENW
jgi:FMN-dependent dehydrogenase